MDVDIWFPDATKEWRWPEAEAAKETEAALMSVVGGRVARKFS